MKEKVIAEVNENINDKNIEKYKIPGVWAVWAMDKRNRKKVCLEVAQTKNIYDEVKSALFILSYKDDFKCKQCCNTYFARQRYKEYSAKFEVHKCKSCDYVSNLRSKSWKRNPRYIDKYRDMISKYEKIVFVEVNVSTEMEDKVKRREAEKNYAKEHQSLYWYG